MSFVESLLTSFLLSGLWLILLAFLGKSLLANLLAKDLEKFKGQIAAQNSERQIIISRLHEKRAEAISKIYLGLIEYHAQCRSFVWRAEHVEEAEREILLNKITEADNGFRGIVQENHLYLTPSLCEKIENLFEEAQSPAHRFIFALGSYVHAKSITKEQYSETWKSAFETFADRLPLLLKELEQEFRLLLGVVE